jgi:hypothetical protein
MSMPKHRTFVSAVIFRLTLKSPQPIGNRLNVAALGEINDIATILLSRESFGAGARGMAGIALDVAAVNAVEGPSDRRVFVSAMRLW